MDICNIAFQYLDESAQVLFIVITMDEKITYANSYSKKICGREIVGLNLSDITVDFVKRTRISNYVVNFEHPPYAINIISADGVPKTYYSKLYKHEDLIYCFASIDVDEVDILRQNLISSNNELNNKSRELHKAIADLKILNEQKNQFIGIAAHDLRNPIGSINSLCELMIEESWLSSDEQRDFLKLIHEASGRLLELLSELLDIAKIESGKISLNSKLFNLADTIKKCLKLNSLLAIKKNINLVFNVAEFVPEVKADELKIEQVVNNLVTNAIKYSYPNSVVNISIFRDARNVIVGIKDAGVGIKQAELDSLFKPFKKLSGRPTDNEKSTGLGLYIVKNIILAHQGKVWLDTNETSGCSFYFSLPLESDQ